MTSIFYQGWDWRKILICQFLSTFLGEMNTIVAKFIIENHIAISRYKRVSIGQGNLSLCWSDGFPMGTSTAFRNQRNTKIASWEKLPSFVENRLQSLGICSFLKTQRRVIGSPNVLHVERFLPASSKSAGCELLYLESRSPWCQRNIWGLISSLFILDNTISNW